MTTALNRQAGKHFFARMHHAQTKKAGYRLLGNYMKNRQKGSKIVTETTKALWNVLVSKIIPATMENIKNEQSAVYSDCVANDQYVAITTIPSLITIMSGGQKELAKKTKTIYNQIQVLMLAGLIEEKINHIHTGFRNPLPSDANPKGRGKIKLVFKSGLIHMRCGQPAPSDSPPPSFFADNGKSLPQYKLSKDSSISIDSKEPESIVNTDLDVDKAALPNGKSSHDMGNRERGRKPPPSDSQKKEAAFSSKEDVHARLKRARLQQSKDERHSTAQHLYNALVRSLYGSKQYNELVRTATVAGLIDHLANAEHAVRAYRTAAIALFKENTIFLQAKRKNVVLKDFQRKLPSPELGALEIMIHAIEKQRKYALKYWNGKVWSPARYIRSKAADKAVGLSIEDWTHIQLKYFERNETSKSWARARTWVNRTFAKRLLQAEREGVAIARQTADNNLKAWLAKSEEDAHLSPEKREAFKQEFINLINSIQ